MKKTVQRVQCSLPMPRLKKVPLFAISTSPALVRHVPAEELSLLTESIRRHGLLQPVGVRRLPGFPARYELLFGYRRLLACRALFLPAIPCLIFPDRKESTVLSLCENFLREYAADERIFSAAHRLNVHPDVLCARLPIPAPQTEKPPKPRDISLFTEEEEPEKSPPLSPAFSTTAAKGILRDARFIANSIDRAVCAGKDAGVSVDVQKTVREREICYKIRLPLREKSASHAKTAADLQIA